MRWCDIRAAHPDQWLVIEALEAHCENDHRVFDRVAVIEACADGRAALKKYAELRRAHPQREYCFVHTNQAALEFEERLWLGIRGLRATDVFGTTSRSDFLRAAGAVIDLGRLTIELA